MSLQKPVSSEGLGAVGALRRAEGVSSEIRILNLSPQIQVLEFILRVIKNFGFILKFQFAYPLFRLESPSSSDRVIMLEAGLSKLLGDGEPDVPELKKKKIKFIRNFKFLVFESK